MNGAAHLLAVSAVAMSSGRTLLGARTSPTTACCNWSCTSASTIACALHACLVLLVMMHRLPLGTIALLCSVGNRIGGASRLVSWMRQSLLCVRACVAKASGMAHRLATRHTVSERKRRVPRTGWQRASIARTVCLHLMDGFVVLFSLVHSGIRGPTPARPPRRIALTGNV